MTRSMLLWEAYALETELRYKCIDIIMKYLHATEAYTSITLRKHNATKPNTSTSNATL